MPAEDNKAVARRFFDGFLNTGDPDVLNELVAARFVHHDNTETRDLDTYEQAIAAAYSGAFAESQFTVEDMIAGGEQVAVRWTWRDIQGGEREGTAATGKHVVQPGITFLRFVGGKIVEVWACYDTFPLRQAG